MFKARKIVRSIINVNKEKDFLLKKIEEFHIGKKITNNIVFYVLFLLSSFLYLILPDINNNSFLSIFNIKEMMLLLFFSFISFKCLSKNKIVINENFNLKKYKLSENKTLFLNHCSQKLIFIYSTLTFLSIPFFDKTYFLYNFLNYFIIINIISFIVFFVIFYVFYNKTYFFSNKKSFYIIESKYAANYNKIKKIHSDISFIKKSKFKMNKINEYYSNASYDEKKILSSFFQSLTNK